MLSKKQIINEILIEWAYRLDSGMPNPTNRDHIWVLSEVLTELGLSEIKNELISNLLEADASEEDKLKPKFKNPILNKIVTYQNKDGKEQKGLVGNLLSNPKDNPGRIAAEKMLPAEGTPQRDELNKELGGDDKSQQPQSGPSAPGVEPQQMGGSLNPETEGGKDYIDSLPDDDPAKPKKSEKIPNQSPNKSEYVYGVAGEGDTDVKNNMVKYGFGAYEKSTGKKPAPGTAGSAFNEIVSGEGVHMLMEDPNISEEELARKMYEQYKDTGLGKEQTKSSGVGKIPKDIENGDLYSKCVITARSAREKYNNSITIAENLQSNGKFGTIDKIDTYYGSAESIQGQTLAIRDAKKVMLPNGTEVDKDDAVAFVKAGGGGMNPSDTATFVKDSDGNLLIQFHSDKTSTSDIQDNSTLVQEGQNYKKSINNSNLTDEQKENAKSIIDEYSIKISKIEDNYNNQAIPIAGRLNELPIQPQMDVIEKEMGTLKKNIDVAIFGASGKLKSQYKNYLPLDKTPEDLTLEEKYIMIRRLVADGKGKGDDVKVINKVGLGLQKVDPTISGIDVKSNLSKQREMVVNLQKERILELNKQGFIDIDGVSVPIGIAMEADETIRGFHLNLMDYPPKGYEKGNPSSMISSLNINMGGTVIDGEKLRSCIGVSNTTEFKQKFRLNESEDVSKDSEGNITGKTVYVYAIDSEGKRIEIGRKVYRSKAGATGRTQNTMVYSSELQKCFKSK